MTEERSLLILYGSQTGTAREVAEDISREAIRKRFKAKLSTMDDYPIANLIEEKIVLFVVCTTGQGDEPSNMKKFWRFLLRRNLPLDSLNTMMFSVFGLGDSSYEKYNFVAKRLQKRLLQLGACELYKRGLGDDQHDLGLYAGLTPWVSGVWETIEQLFPLPEGLQPLSDEVLLDPKFEVSIENENIQSNQTNKDILIKHLAPDSYSSTLINTKRITPDHHFQDVRHLIFDLPSELSYEPGDVLMLQPENIEEKINRALDFFGFDCNQIVTFNPFSHSRGSISITTHELFQCYLDICGRPSRYFFELLSFFAEEEREQERLKEFSLPENQDELFDYIHRPRRTCLEVFDDFPSLKGKVPLKYMFDLFAPISPRAFSICSSLKKHLNEIHICAAIVDYKTNLFTRRTGVCTQWLARLKSKTKVNLWIEKGTIKLPNKESSMLMIGPGTGVAPFRSFIEDRIADNENKGIKQKVGTLVFGNRNIYNDYFFEDEWKQYVANEYLSVITAFSRDQERKVYVQHKIREHGAQIWAEIEKGCHIYICGNSKQMPKNVEEALIDVLHEFGHMSPQNSKEILDTMKKEKKFLLETW